MQKRTRLSGNSGIIERMVDPMPNEEEKVGRLRRAMYSRSLSPKFKDRGRRTLEEDRTDVSEDWDRQEPELEGTIVAPKILFPWRRAAQWLGIAFGAFLIGV